MAQVLLNSSVAILIAAAFLGTVLAAIRNETRAMQRVPVRIRQRRQDNR
jgi:hypothetical protein